MCKKENRSHYKSPDGHFNILVPLHIFLSLCVCIHTSCYMWCLKMYFFLNKFMQLFYAWTSISTSFLLAP